MARRPPRSAASRVFTIVVAAVLLFGLLMAGVLAFEGQRAARAEAERVTQAVAETLADSPSTQEHLASGDRDTASAVLQPVAQAVMVDAAVDFVTIMTPDGTRITHANPQQIGALYLGTIPDRPETLTEQFTGTLGASLRTIVPVVSDGEVVGWVSVGVTLDSVTSALIPRLTAALAITMALVVAGFIGALVVRRATRNVTGDLQAGQIRDTLASAESLRTLGEALRSQTHEHGNRIHAAVALLELGRTDRAIALLTDSSRRTQALADQVAARTHGDATVGALLIGKAAQAAERGIRWEAEIAPDAPRSVLSAVDAVALVGNLVDNAMDAAADGEDPRWVRVVLARTAFDELLITVADSGVGVEPQLAERIFERGFSTKPSGDEGRGVGLALARSVVDAAGGSLTVRPGPPTEFRVILPAEES